MRVNNYLVGFFFSQQLLGFGEGGGQVRRGATHSLLLKIALRLSQPFFSQQEVGSSALASGSPEAWIVGLETKQGGVPYVALG